MQYFSALKKDISTHVATWMNPEDIMLSEVSYLQKNKYCMIPLIGVPRIVNSQRLKVEWRQQRADGRREQGVTV